MGNGSDAKIHMQSGSNMRKRILYFIIIVGLMVISSCQKTNDEIMPGLNIPVEELNQKVEILSYPGMPETHKNGEMLVFLLRNKSDQPIIFDQDFGSLVFIKQGNDWKQVQNKWGYPEVENILSRYDVDPAGLVLTVMPEVGDLEGEITVRVLVIGHLKEVPSEQAGAYIDVHYAP